MKIKRTQASLARWLLLLPALFFAHQAHPLGPEPTRNTNALVVSCHKLTGQAGTNIMRSGGNTEPRGDSRGWGWRIR